jgi:hypothetical protein
MHRIKILLRAGQVLGRDGGEFDLRHGYA